jgi:undecaprenyl-diphosphatase
MLRQRSSRVTLAIAAGVWAFTVGLSRVALVVHWPTDVLGAWLFVLVTVPGVGLLLRRVMRSRSPVPDGSDGRARA